MATPSWDSPGRVMSSIVENFGSGSSSSSMSSWRGLDRFCIAGLASFLFLFRIDLMGRIGGVPEGGVVGRWMISFSLFEVDSNRSDLALAALAKRDLGTVRPCDCRSSIHWVRRSFSGESGEGGVGAVGYWRAGGVGG